MTISRVATPTAFPASGTFAVSQMVTLLSDTPGAAIHFTTDGSMPTAESPVFDQYRLPPLPAVNDGDRGVTSTYAIRAIATKDGLAPSAVATFDYTIQRRSKDVYLSTEVHPGVYQLKDFDDTKMMVIVGTKRAMLIDAGLGLPTLKPFVDKLTGGLPLDVIITHGHPDHIAALAPFQGVHDVYMNHRDLPMVQMFSDSMKLGIDLASIIQLEEGRLFDLGGRTLTVYEVPGHTAGHLVLFDEANGLLFASDAVGSNRSTITDSLWMQFPGMSPIDDYLSSLRVFRDKVRGRIKESYGGHNDEVIYGEAYLDNLEQAAQLLVDRGEAVLTPSLRPIDSDIWQVVVGDRLTDPNWAAINVAKPTCLSIPPDQIATLSNLRISGATLSPGFKPGQLDYTAKTSADQIELTPIAMSTRHRSLTVNGSPAKSGKPFAATLKHGDNSFAIAVTAPDGQATRTYTLVVTRG